MPRSAVRTALTRVPAGLVALLLVGVASASPGARPDVRAGAVLDERSAGNAPASTPREHGDLASELFLAASTTTTSTPPVADARTAGAASAPGSSAAPRGAGQSATTAPVPPPPAPTIPTPLPPSPSAVTVMGASRLSGMQIATWFREQTRPTYRALVPIETLAALFVEEGAVEGVRGDIAFAQSIIETGWFSFGGRVPASANNFSGLGATDGTTSYAVFPDARTGVRAQIQHLRAYADPAVTVANLHRPLVDPRFSLVSPKGKARTWNQMGNGNWATSTDYAPRIIEHYRNMSARFGLPLA